MEMLGKARSCHKAPHPQAVRREAQRLAQAERQRQATSPAWWQAVDLHRFRLGVP